VLYPLLLVTTTAVAAAADLVELAIERQQELPALIYK
jgi:hypothetical protein